MHKVNWDDLRFVLAVADTGSVNAASKSLGVNHATVLRRIAAFEEASGGPIFEREATGYKLRTDRTQVIEAARLAAQHVRSVEDLMRGRAAQPGALIRLTSTDSLCQTVLAQVFPALSRRIAPDKLVYLQSNAHLDLARLNADVCVRPAVSLPEELTGYQIGQMSFAVYHKVGVSQPAAWLGLAGALSNSLPARWMAENIDPLDIVSSADSFCSLSQIASAGSCRVILPCVLGDANSALQRVRFGPMPHCVVPIWVACHQDMAASDRIKRCMGALMKLVKPLSGQLSGQT